MPKLRSIGPKVQAKDTNPIRPQAKVADAHYLTPEHRAWAQAVIRRAGAQCEHIDRFAVRCAKSYPDHRMHADHISELKDGGARLDVGNGMCLCSEHHTIKTNEARARRWR